MAVVFQIHLGKPVPSGYLPPRALEENRRI